MKKGFTLIELLAVIVILAIIAVIAVPIVVSIIKNTQTAADERSLESYAKIMETAYYEAKLETSSLSLEEYLKQLEKGKVKISYKGSKIECEEKRSVMLSKVDTLELYGCMINERGPYKYVNRKAERYTLYKIKTDLENVEIDLNIKTIEEGDKYISKIKVNEGYKLEEENIEIKMDGKDIKSKSYSEGKIEIEKVTGDIEIKIKGTKKTYNVISELTNVKVISEKDVIEHGDSYQATLSADNLYEIESVTITMDGEDITSSYNEETKIINIDNVTGNIKIIAKAKITTFTVTSSLSKVTTSNSIKQVKKGESYQAVLTKASAYATDDYVIIITIEMNGIDETTRFYNNGIINIDNVTGDIKIVARVAQKKQNIEAEGITVYYDVSKGSLCTKEEYESSYYEPENDFTNSKAGYNGIIKTREMQNGCLKFYKYAEDDEKQLMILDHNTSSKIKWHSSGRTKEGPKEVIEQLKLDTEEWQGTITPSNYKFEFNETTSFLIDYSKYKARLIAANEIATITKNTGWSGTTANDSYFFDSLESTASDTCKKGDISGCKYGWLYDRTNTNCITFGCLNDGNSTNDGYWTSAAVFKTYDRSGFVKYNGMIAFDWPYASWGVRPVIEISKS